MTISFNSLGNLGRLGNQMFQLASLWGIASNRGYDFCIPGPEFFGLRDGNVKNSDANIYNTFKLKKFNHCMSQNETLEERCFEFDSKLFDDCPDNVDLIGYFQSEKYFKHIESDIRDAFTIIDDIRIPTLESFKSNFGDSDVISLHIRRGDYLNLTHHPVQSLEYYSMGLSLMPKDIPVMIFSDDVEWCRDQELFKHDRFILSENNSTGVDLCLQSLCSHHIIANSSFSWWGAWLAKSKKVVAPKSWFGPPLTHDTKDLYIDGWILC
jgi:hypothetical protein